jgi:hypothetical protein
MTVTTTVRPDPTAVEATIDLTETAVHPMESRWRIVLRGALMGVGFGAPRIPDGAGPAGADRPIDPGAAL